MVAWPGAEPAEVASRVIEPIERAVWGLSRVEHVYSTAATGFALVTVRFQVGEPYEPSLVEVRERLAPLAGRCARGDGAGGRAAHHERRAVPDPSPCGASGALERRPAAARRPSSPASSPRSRRPARRT